MIATTLGLRPGDVVVLPPPPFPKITERTVKTVKPMEGWSAPGGPLFTVSYVEPRSEQWSEGNSGTEYSLWQTTSWRTLASMIAGGTSA